MRRLCFKRFEASSGQFLALGHEVRFEKHRLTICQKILRREHA